MDNELKTYGHIISDMKNGILKVIMETKTGMDSSYFWESLNEWIDKFMRDYPYKEQHKVTESTQKKLKKYMFELTEKMLCNQKFISVAKRLREKREESEKLNAVIDNIYEEGYLIFEEREKLNNYINFESINQFLLNNGGEEVSSNTLSKWNTKGFLGESLTEKDICPNSFDNHRTVYFPKDKVVDFLIKEGKIYPKYEILEQIEEGTVLKYVITKDNVLGYYCKEFETEVETVVIPNGQEDAE